MARSVCEMQKCSDSTHSYTLCSSLCLFKKTCGPNVWPLCFWREEKQLPLRACGFVFCVGFNCNGRQNKVGLEMLDLLSSLNSFNPNSTNASVLKIDYIYAVTSQWKAMGTTCRILTFSGKPYVFFQLSTAPGSWWVPAHSENKIALPPPCCHSPR